MALVNCPICGEKVSDKAVKCLGCGSDLTSKTEEPKMNNTSSLKKDVDVNLNSNVSAIGINNKNNQEYRQTYIYRVDKKPRRSGFAVLGILMGILIIVIGVIMIIAANSKLYSFRDYVREASFGADFYTYEYSATRIAVMNTGQLGIVMKDLMTLGGAFIALFGFIVIAYFGEKPKRIIA